MKNLLLITLLLFTSSAYAVDGYYARIAGMYSVDDGTVYNNSISPQTCVDAVYPSPKTICSQTNFVNKRESYDGFVGMVEVGSRFGKDNKYSVFLMLTGGSTPTHSMSQGFIGIGYTFE